jgi:ABC-2 type transport system permease protein
MAPASPLLFGALVSTSLRRSLSNRADLAFELVIAVVGAASSLAALGAVYTRAGSLGGWDPASAIVLLGTFQIVSGLRAALVDPNVEWFQQRIKDGRLDHILTQPASLLFTYALPVGLIATVPAGALVRQTVPAAVAGALIGAATLCALTVAVWRRGLRRYTSAAG